MIVDVDDRGEIRKIVASTRTTFTEEEGIRRGRTLLQIVKLIGSEPSPIPKYKARIV
jgi:hypothetical protein